jgi:hypothetical protein
MVQKIAFDAHPCIDPVEVYLLLQVISANCLSIFKRVDLK